MKEIRIAGGGLAGLSLALGLRRSAVPVTVCEAGRYPRHRVCGEFISGVAPSTLETLGIASSLADVRRHRHARWFRGGREILDTELPEPALGISRWRLDERLQQSFRAAGGELLSGKRLRREPAEGRVWAAGRLPVKSHWIGLKCHVLRLADEGGLEMHLGPNGYAGLSPVEDGRVNVCGLFRIERAMPGKGAELMFSYLEAGGHRGLVERLRAAEIDDSSCCGVAGFRLGMQPAEPELCAIGDAWGMIPPFTGNGMSMAFESAELALEPLVQWSRGQLAWSEAVRRIRGLGERRFRRRLRSALALHRVLLHGRGQDLIEALATHGMLPFRPLLSLVR
ncbi:NAD(P)/FAD-dependent oxidoreductase [Haloferula sargassicola]|uniref:Uncharacterized protein n=1 Tax=Haloferula sargassicola TaxID=490096 RepID=A0ABP9USJ9_9BACT